VKSSNLGKRLFANWPAKIISLTVAVVIFFMYRIDTQQEFSIPLDKKLPAGFAISNDYPKRIELIIRGIKYSKPIEENNFYAFFDVSNIKTEGQVQVKIEVKFLGENLKPGTFEFEYRPTEISVQLEQEIEKKVAIIADIEGSPPKGYKLEYQLDRREVIIRGPRSHVEKINEVTTAKIDLTNRTEEMKPTPISIITGDSFVRSVEEVKLQISVTQEQASKTFTNVEISLINLSPSLEVLSELQPGTVEVKGIQAELDNLSSDKIKLIINCSEVIEPGDYFFDKTKIEPRVDGKATVFNYEPQSILIRFGNK
jgi:hypothetical protein